MGGNRTRKTMRRLWNGIDRQLYHKAFKKQGKRVERVCAFEKGQSGTHLHYHIATMPPKDIDISFDNYRLLIANELGNGKTRTTRLIILDSWLR